MSRECNEGEITIDQLLKVAYDTSQRIKIYVVGDGQEQNLHMKHGFYLTRNLTGCVSETERVLKYYKDVPVWGLHVEVESTGPVHKLNEKKKGEFAVTSVIASIVVYCHYGDIIGRRHKETQDKLKELNSKC